MSTTITSPQGLTKKEDGGTGSISVTSSTIQKNEHDDGIGLMNIYNYEPHRDNPIFLIIITIIIIVYYLIFSNLGIGSSSQSGSPSASSAFSSFSSYNSPQRASVGIFMMEMLMWAVFIFLLLVNAMQYIFKIDVSAAIKDIFSPNPSIELNINQDGSVGGKPNINFQKQVFHIPNNTYTYEDAKAVCAAYDAELATYDQVEETYKQGGEWCSYGWSDGQMVLFPTQKDTYERLQKVEGHENDCGRTGINGGKVTDPKRKYGANCYGYKPRITTQEQELMAHNSLYPKSKKDFEFENKVTSYRDNLSRILISPFNKFKWSII